MGKSRRFNQLSRSKFRLVLTALAVFAGAYLMLKFIDRVPEKNDMSGVFHFHPDMVLRFTWTAISSESREFSRATRQTAWTPSVDPRQIQNKLNVLSTIAITPMKSFEKRSDQWPIEFEIEFAPGNSWKGAFDGEVFIWLTGNKQGQGAELDLENRRMFYDGRFAFGEPKWNWCPKRPQKISFKVDEDDYVLSQTGTDWVLKKSEIERKLDPTSVENWLGANCSDEIVFTRDMHLFPFGIELFTDTVEFIYDDGSKAVYKIKDRYFLVNDQMAIVPLRLASGLKQLVNLP